MDHLRAMRVFIRVAERGNLTATSSDLGLSRGGASAIVSELEKYLGVQLLERTTRRLRLTEDGQQYLEQARDIIAMVEGLEDDIGSSERQPRGRLRVQVPSGLARIVIAPALPQFIDAYPRIQLEILSRNNVPDFVGERIDAALVVGDLPELDIVARPVGKIPYLTVAAPSYLNRHGMPETPEDLDRHYCIPLLSSATGTALSWRFRVMGENITVPVRGALAFEAPEAAVAAACRGAGILQLASYLVYDEIRSGRLVSILDEIRPKAQEMHIVHQKHRLKPKKLRVFEEFIIDLNLQVRRKWGIRQVD